MTEARITDQKKPPESSNLQYWWLNANPTQWKFSDLALGDVQSYTVRNENNNYRQIKKNFVEIKVGDKLVGYESTPLRKIVAFGEVVKKEDGKEVFFKKTGAITNPIGIDTLKSHEELLGMECLTSQKRLRQGSLFKLTKGEYDFILELANMKDPVSPKDSDIKYRDGDFLTDVYMDESYYNELKALLEHKMNIILQGAPGVGKTWAATRLAYAMMGEKDDSRIKSVQFHQNYSYEDFVMGYKPFNSGFKLTEGIFFNFCEDARKNYPNKYFFLIDEINRGNMSKIFGELLSRIELSYRNKDVTLAYSGKQFSVPDNVYIIGMMNTADRSLAMIDYALRRRFSFFEMDPAFESKGFAAYQNKLGNILFNKLITKIIELNTKITDDNSLGKGFCIGHSYFCNLDNDKISDINARLREIVNYDIIPMLREYWFDDKETFYIWRNELQKVLDNNEG